MNLLQAGRDRFSLSCPKIRNRNAPVFGLRQRNILYAFRMIQVAQETITALAHVDVNVEEEERDSMMEVLTEVPSSGVVCNILQGSSLLSTVIKIPHQETQMQRPSTSSFPQIETAVYFLLYYPHLLYNAWLTTFFVAGGPHFPLPPQSSSCYVIESAETSACAQNAEITCYPQPAQKHFLLQIETLKDIAQDGFEYTYFHRQSIGRLRAYPADIESTIPLQSRPRSSSRVHTTTKDQGQDRLMECGCVSWHGEGPCRVVCRREGNR